MADTHTSAGERPVPIAAPTEASGAEPVWSPQHGATGGSEATGHRRRGEAEGRSGRVAPPPDVDLAPVAPRSRPVTVLLAALAALAIAGVAFGAGRMTASSTGSQGFGSGTGPGAPGIVPGGVGPQGASGFPGAVPGAGGAFAPDDAVRGNVLDGTVTAVSPEGLTIRAADGTSIEVPTTPTTTYHSLAAAGAGDVTVGSGVRLVVRFAGGTRLASDVTITSR